MSTEHHGHGPTLTVPRSRGAVSGLALILLGAWGALLPYVGPSFTFGYGPDQSWHWTAARFWLQLLPGVVTVVAGVFLLLGGNRVTGTLFAYLAVAAGAWFVVGPILADLRQAGYVGAPLGGNDRAHYDAIAAFYGLGAVIVFFGALAAGRLSVVGVRDVAKRDAKHEDTVVDTETPAQAVYPPSRNVDVRTTSVRPVEEPVRTTTATSAAGSTVAGTVPVAPLGATGNTGGTGGTADRLPGADREVGRD